MRLDRYDSYLTEFHATVVGTKRDDRGLWLLLDRSAFYPTAGGQPHDTGELSLDGTPLRVLDVQAAGEEVWHLVHEDPAVAVEGAAVHGFLEWPRRYRHMQRHTAQHILSQALVRVNPAFETLSVSMRGPDCTIDFGGEADADALAAVEAEANRAARLALTVMTFEMNDSRLGEYRLRRPPKVSGLVRLVAVGDYDLVACGGTHLRNSAEALPIKVLGLEHVKGGLNRLTFRAGEEAQDDYGAKHAVASTLGVALSVPLEGLLGRVEQLRADLAEASRRLTLARAAQAAALAEDLAARAEAGCVTAYLAGEEALLFAELVNNLQHRPGLVTLVAAEDVAATRVRLAFLAGPDSNLDLRPALQAVLEQLGGRGGGRPDRAQGATEAEEAQVRAVLATVADDLRA